MMFEISIPFPGGWSPYPGWFRISSSKRITNPERLAGSRFFSRRING